MTRVRNNLDRVLATIRFRKLRFEEVLALIEEIEQLRKENAEAAVIVAELLPAEADWEQQKSYKTGDVVIDTDGVPGVILNAGEDDGRAVDRDGDGSPEHRADDAPGAQADPAVLEPAG